MAGVIDKIKESALTCPVCLNTYNTGANKPKSVHAGHTMCANCLAQLPEKSADTIACPLCNTNVPRSSVNVDAVVFQIIEEIEKYDKGKGETKESKSEADVGARDSKDGKSASAAPGAGSLKTGDWICLKCSDHNFASRSMCRKCKAAKPDRSVGTAVKAGDWICTKCADHNFASRSACRKCGAAKVDGAKPEAPGAGVGAGAGRAPSGDWHCRCGEMNFASRTECRKCRNRRKA